jgi:hypothetical protein
MTGLLRSIALGAAVAACVVFSPLQAQDTVIARPNRTELPRVLPQAPMAAPAPFQQQSPNGLYQLAVTDTGIVLKGPAGTVAITNAGIQIGGPREPQVKIEATEFRLRAGQNTILETGQNLNIRANANLDLRSSAYLTMGGGAGVTVTGARLNLGCPSGKPAARTGDQINAGTSPATVAQGSTSVFVC